jgi:hypothetical protein
MDSCLLAWRRSTCLLAHRLLSTIEAASPPFNGAHAEQAPH